MSPKPLPNEVLLHIFSYLTYSDLKLAIPSVSKHFKQLLDNACADVKSGPLAIALFHDNIPPSKEEGYTQYQLSQIEAGAIVDHPNLQRVFYVHPALASGCLMAGEAWEVEDVKFRRGEKTKLISTPVANENAVSPAVTKLGLRLSNIIGSRTPLHLTSKAPQGITVLDVMNAWVEIKRELRRRVEKHNTIGHRQDWPGVAGWRVRFEDGMLVLIILA